MTPSLLWFGLPTHPVPPPSCRGCWPGCPHTCMSTAVFSQDGTEVLWGSHWDWHTHVKWDLLNAENLARFLRALGWELNISECEYPVAGQKDREPLWKKVLPIPRRSKKLEEHQIYSKELLSLMFLLLIDNYVNESTGRYSSRKASLFWGRAASYSSQVGLSKQSSKRPQNCDCNSKYCL